MKWHRIWAVVVRHIIQLPQDFNQWVSLLFWPILDIVLFGFVGVWFHAGATDAELIALLAGVTLWQFITRINFDISLSLLEEAWSHNTVNLFATPLNIIEWLAGVILKGIMLGIGTLLASIAFVWITFGYNLLNIGSYFIYTTMQLFLSGVALGLCGAALLLRWGPRIQTLLFLLGFIACPISGAFYPVYVLPAWVEKLAYAFPFVYIFEGLFFYIYDGIWHTQYIVYASTLNGICVLASYLFFMHCYRVAKIHGIQQLTD